MLLSSRMRAVDTLSQHPQWDHRDFSTLVQITLLRYTRGIVMMRRRILPRGSTRSMMAVEASAGATSLLLSMDILLEMDMWRKGMEAKPALVVGMRGRMGLAEGRGEETCRRKRRIS